jgi:hypothetical protein
MLFWTEGVIYAFWTLRFLNENRQSKERSEAKQSGNDC